MSPRVVELERCGVGHGNVLLFVEDDRDNVGLVFGRRRVGRETENALERVHARRRLIGCRWDVVSLLMKGFFGTGRHMKQERDVCRLCPTVEDFYPVQIK